MKVSNINNGVRHNQVEVSFKGFQSRPPDSYDMGWKGSVALWVNADITRFSFHMPIAHAEALLKELESAITYAKQ